MSIPRTATVEVPVLIVGAGPAGLAHSVALRRKGVGYLVVDRPRATAAYIRCGWQLTTLAQDQDGVTSVVEERDGEATLAVRSRSVVGADSARSRVPGQAGLTGEGSDNLAGAANIWFRADLSRYL